MKKIISIVLILCLSFAATAYSAVDFEAVLDETYSEMAGTYPDYVKTFHNSGITDTQIKSFYTDVFAELSFANNSEEITKDNLESKLILAVQNAAAYKRNAAVSDALMENYFLQLYYIAEYGTLPSEFIPLYETFETILFKNPSILEDYYEVAVEKLAEAAKENAESEEISFPDCTANTHPWAIEAVGALSKLGIINGFTDGTFRPDANITRAEFVKIATLAFNMVDSSAKADFTDVSKDDWYYSYVGAAQKNGIITGDPDGSFRPNDGITRQDLSLIIYRIVNKNAISSENETRPVKFTDEASIANYALTAVYKMQTLGIINGFTDGSFHPVENATRAQTAKIIYGVLKLANMIE